MKVHNFPEEENQFSEQLKSEGRDGQKKRYFRHDTKNYRSSTMATSIPNLTKLIEVSYIQPSVKYRRRNKIISSILVINVICVDLRHESIDHASTSHCTDNRSNGKLLPSLDTVNFAAIGI